MRYIGFISSGQTTDVGITHLGCPEPALSAVEGSPLLEPWEPMDLYRRLWLRLSWISVSALLLWVSAAVLSATPQKPPPIRGEGCVESGVESRCLMVKDIKNGMQYNLFVKGIQPAIGSGIEFSGVPHRGMSTCVQGTDVDVVSWVRKDLKCTDGTAPKPKDQH